MFELIVIACSFTLSGPQVCSRYTAHPGVSVSQLQCNQQSVMTLVQWAAEHPELKIKRWFCQETGERLGRA